MVFLETEAGTHPVQCVFVRGRRRSTKKWLVLITADITLTGDEVIRLYGNCWDIAGFFKTV